MDLLIPEDLEQLHTGQKYLRAAPSPAYLIFREEGPVQAGLAWNLRSSADEQGMKAMPSGSIHLPSQSREPGAT